MTERPRLILLNGPPGIGKSTLAQRYVDDHPLALNLDIDELRAHLGAWEEHPESKQLSRDLGKELARTHLTAGHDVVVPQLLLRFEVVDEFRDIAVAVAADFVEIVVLGGESENLERFRRRRAAIAADGTRHPAMLVEPDREDEAIAFSHERLRTRAAEDPSAHVIEIVEGAIDDAYHALIEIVDR